MSRPFYCQSVTGKDVSLFLLGLPPTSHLDLAPAPTVPTKLFSRATSPSLSNAACISLGFSAPPNPADHVLFLETPSLLSYLAFPGLGPALPASHVRLTIIASTPMTPNTARAGPPLLSSKLLAYQSLPKRSLTSQTKAARNVIYSFNVQQILNCQ